MADRRRKDDNGRTGEKEGGVRMSDIDVIGQ